MELELARAIILHLIVLLLVCAAIKYRAVSMATAFVLAFILERAALWRSLTQFKGGQFWAELIDNDMFVVAFYLLATCLVLWEIKFNPIGKQLVRHVKELERLRAENVALRAVVTMLGDKLNHAPSHSDHQPQSPQGEAQILP